MIKSLYIKDFALIDELEVDFEEGLNILTGQTGAGKSIIIGALNMILGERADTDVIRQGKDKAISEATIRVGEDADLRALLEENEVEFSEYLILRREIRNTGSRAFINDTPVNIGVLKAAGDLLVDLHGQHDHQLLLKEENHQGVIDGFGEVEPILKDYKAEYKKMTELQKELRLLQKRENELQEKTELYRFQVQELEEARLGEIYLEQLESEMNLLDNAEVLDQKAAAISEMADTDDGNIVQLLNFLKLNLEDLARIEPEFENYLKEINAARVSVNEAIAFAERYRNSIEFNPKRLEELRQRQSELNRLQKKYQRDLPELISYLHEIQRELSIADNFDLEIEKLENQIQMQAKELKDKAILLHQTRLKIGEELAVQIQQELAKVGIPHSKLDVRVDWLLSDNGWVEVEGKQIECTETGCDDLRMFISTNKGEEPKPLAKIASGGEISRVMLALKSILAKEQSLPVMIFDEIDTGISGEISEKVGASMRKLSEHCQIIAITHQPQIASQAHKHYKVAKAEEGERTVSKIIPLSDEEHIHEIASLMSGSQISESALNSARELIEKNTFKN
ncbi:MAG: DNA repair protein RecN [Gracilimonas sp.]|uniref:DNA repair protein RecN n=1 Tax=Gracilimonas TaxID=649462 RepID=UPI001B124F8F|nr:DNA repair protein RecN [Gracilimonas sp.]MBO6584551.1 DNA repair protein RecN [Gracilimonas sp.]MBO6616178.1 DNA repair protein RecN [Gracilimonas sp.]